MKITRRNFLIGTGAVGATAAVSGFTLHRLPAVLELAQEDIRYNFGLLVNYTTRTISIANDHPAMSVYDLQRALFHLWKEEDEFIRHPFPCIPVTPEYIEMTDGWTVEEGSILSHIESGALTQEENGNKEYYLSVVSLGQWTLDQNPDSFIPYNVTTHPAPTYPDPYTVKAEWKRTQRITKPVQMVGGIKYDDLVNCHGREIQNFTTQAGSPGGLRVAICRDPEFMPPHGGKFRRA